MPISNTSPTRLLGNQPLLLWTVPLPFGHTWLALPKILLVYNNKFFLRCGILQNGWEAGILNHYTMHAILGLNLRAPRFERGSPANTKVVGHNAPFIRKANFSSTGAFSKEVPVASPIFQPARYILIFK